MIYVNYDNNNLVDRNLINKFLRPFNLQYLNSDAKN